MRPLLAHIAALAAVFLLGPPVGAVQDASRDPLLDLVWTDGETEPLIGALRFEKITKDDWAAWADAKRSDYRTKNEELAKKELERARGFRVKVLAGAALESLGEPEEVEELLKAYLGDRWRETGTSGKRARPKDELRPDRKKAKAVKKRLGAVKKSAARLDDLKTGPNFELATEGSVLREGGLDTPELSQETEPGGTGGDKDPSSVLDADADSFKPKGPSVLAKPVPATAVAVEQAEEKGWWERATGWWGDTMSKAPWNRLADEVSTEAGATSRGLGFQGGGHNDQQDAWRHARWHQRMVVSMGGKSTISRIPGAVVALGAGTAHEVMGLLSGQPWAEAKMDMANNWHGVLAGLDTDDATRITALLEGGMLTVVDPKDRVPTRPSGMPSVVARAE